MSTPCKYCGQIKKQMHLPPMEEFRVVKPVTLCVRCDRLDLFPRSST